MPGSETIIDVQIDGELHSGSYSVTQGIMTGHLGANSKEAPVGHATPRVLARILIDQLVRENTVR
jgi:hypothetical protein